jgi:DNA invertase Pin-like site-specific DNA recombinase
MTSPRSRRAREAIIVIIISAIAELDRSLIIERGKSGLRRAKLEGKQIGRPLGINREQGVIDRLSKSSLWVVARA